MRAWIFFLAAALFMGVVVGYVLRLEHQCAAAGGVRLRPIGGSWQCYRVDSLIAVPGV